MAMAMAMAMSTAASFFTSSSSLQCGRSHFLSPPLLRNKGVRGQRFVILNVRCELEGSKGIFQSECRTTSSSSADDRSISTYKWCAALGSIGLLDMAYLTYLKLTDSDVFFPMGEGSILTSEFSIFALTFGLFFITIKDFGSEKIKKMLASQLCTSLAIIAVCTSYPVLPSLAVTEMPYVKTEITGESSPLALSLARHLHSIGAKLYGAFWCSHCVHQKQMFGSEAAKLLDYVECYPDGIKAGTRMAEACSNIDLQAFPSWVINGEVLSGEKKFPELAQLSGMKLENLSE